MNGRKTKRKFFYERFHDGVAGSYAGKNFQRAGNFVLVPREFRQKNLPRIQTVRCEFREFFAFVRNAHAPVCPRKKFSVQFVFQSIYHPAEC